MRALTLGLVAAATLVSGCSTYGGGLGGFGGPRYAYDYDRPDPAYGGYYADRYYVDNARYRERVWVRTIASMSVRTAAIIAAATTAPPA